MQLLILLERRNLPALCLSAICLLGIFQQESLAETPLDKAIALTNAGKYAESIEYLRRSNDARTQSTRLYYSGYCYYKLGDLNTARTLFTSITKAYPKSREAALAEAFLKQLSGSPIGLRDAASSPTSNESQVGSASRTGSSSGMPDARSSPSSLNEDAGNDDDPGDLASIPDSSRIYFTQGDHGHMFVDSYVNGRPLKCMFDTGATGFTLGFNHLRQVGLAPPQGSPQGVNSGWAGRSVPIWFMDVNLKMGPITRRIRAKVQEEMNMEPLIGYAFMKGLKYEIDNKGRCMIVTKPARTTAGSQDNDLYDIPCKMVNTKAVVPLRVNNKQIAAFVDTGSSSTIMNMATLAKLGVEIPNDAPTEYGSGIGGVTTFRIVEMDLRFGPISKQSFPVRIGGNCGNAIGQDFLSGWRFTIDQDKQMLRFFH